MDIIVGLAPARRKTISYNLCIVFDVFSRVFCKINARLNILCTCISMSIQNSLHKINRHAEYRHASGHEPLFLVLLLPPILRCLIILISYAGTQHEAHIQLSISICITEDCLHVLYLYRPKENCTYDSCGIEKTFCSEVL